MGGNHHPPFPLCDELPVTGREEPAQRPALTRTRVHEGPRPSDEVLESMKEGLRRPSSSCESEVGGGTSIQLRETQHPASSEALRLATCTMDERLELVPRRSSRCQETF